MGRATVSGIVHKIGSAMTPHNAHMVRGKLIRLVIEPGRMNATYISKSIHLSASSTNLMTCYDTFEADAGGRTLRLNIVETERGTRERYQGEKRRLRVVTMRSVGSPHCQVLLTLPNINRRSMMSVACIDHRSETTTRIRRQSKKAQMEARTCFRWIFGDRLSRISHTMTA